MSFCKASAIINAISCLSLYLLCVIFTHLSGLLIYVTFILYWSLHCTSLSFDPSLACLSKSNLCECLSVGCQIGNAASNEVYASVSMWGVNKEAAEAITHQQPWVCLCMCVCAYGEGVKATEPPWHTYGCLSTDGGIDLEGKKQTEMNSDPQRYSTVHVWVC